MPDVSAEEAPRLKPYMALAEKLGSLVGQLAHGDLPRVSVETEGAAAQLNQAGHKVTVYERDDRVGGLLMYGLSTQILKERGQFRDVIDLARDTMEIWRPSWDGSAPRVSTRRPSPPGNRRAKTPSKAAAVSA